MITLQGSALFELSTAYALPDLKRQRTLSSGLSDNFVVTSGGERYFLKRYRHDSEDDLRRIHRVKTMFAPAFPVVMPRPTTTGQTWVTIAGRHYALFPFIDAPRHQRGKQPDSSIVSLASTLGRLHKYSTTHQLQIDLQTRDWNRTKRLAQARAILRILDQIKAPTRSDRLARAEIELRIPILQTETRQLADFELPPPILIHGDFHDNNVFFDRRGWVNAIFDWEKATMAPRTLELWRSLDFICLDGHYSAPFMRQARRFLAAYRRVCPIRRTELLTGLDLYITKRRLTLWIEEEHYLKNNPRFDRFLVRHLAGSKFWGSQSPSDILTLFI